MISEIPRALVVHGRPRDPPWHSAKILGRESLSYRPSSGDNSKITSPSYSRGSNTWRLLGRDIRIVVWRRISARGANQTDGMAANGDAGFSAAA